MYKFYILFLFSFIWVTQTYANVIHEKKNSSYMYDSDRTINQQYLKIINNKRSKDQSCGHLGDYKAMPQLRWSDKLYRASLEHSKDMATHNLTLHKGSGKATDVTGRKSGWISHKAKALERAKYHGYKHKKELAFAENVGAGHKTVNAIVSAWMESPSHCANIMSPHFKEMALTKAVNASKEYHTYWTLDLGYRR